ncbi:MAG: treZ [Microvirga sp.]|jgi:maltooligosyltrehalose trehalohydrolase|nr:treZ [Microvirga sp.]
MSSAHQSRPASKRRFPIGAEFINGQCDFRVWAPDQKQVELLIDGRAPIALDGGPDGYFSVRVSDVAAGARYAYRLDGEGPVPDLASRFQPTGVHGPSAVIDPSSFAWTDKEWPGLPRTGNVLYEMHIGTFTPQGTFAAAMEYLGFLKELSVTAIELMPVADFPGDFGWGYDGVDLFAPRRLYGEPDDLRRFVDRAHELGIGVILDVVYNHLGPDGSYLAKFADAYFNDNHECEWGRAINFDGSSAEGSRAFFIANAGYWIEEFHFDGLRLDATQQIFDASAHHILDAIAAEARARAAAQGRTVLLVAENEPQDARLVRTRDKGGYGLDALWNDDFHHAAMVALNGRREAYYSDYAGSAQEFVASAKWGFLYQGQYYAWQKQRRGAPALDLPPASFVTFLQNHDQVANSGHGRRVHQETSPGRFRAMTALGLLMPGTPMLFQGQEWASSSPFLYFADHKADLATNVDAGRREFLSQFPSLAEPDMAQRLAPPAERVTFERCQLNHAEREQGDHALALALHRDLLALRRDPVLQSQQAARALDGAVLGEHAFVLRFFGRAADDLMLVVNLGPELVLASPAIPLLAPPAGASWEIVFASEDPRYGGSGAPHPEIEQGWRLAGESAVLLRAAGAAERVA